MSSFDIFFWSASVASFDNIWDIRLSPKLFLLFHFNLFPREISLKKDGFLYFMVDMVLMNSHFLNIFLCDKSTAFSIELIRIRIFPPTTASAIYTLSNKKNYSSRLQCKAERMLGLSLLP